MLNQVSAVACVAYIAKRLSCDMFDVLMLFVLLMLISFVAACFCVIGRRELLAVDVVAVA